MKNLLVLVGVGLVVCVCNNNVQAHPHRSIEDTDEDVSSDSDSDVSPAVHSHLPIRERDSSRVREMTSHESKSHEDEDSSEEDRDDNISEVDDYATIPRTEPLCPARPEEITNIESECAREYQLWRELRAKKDMTTTIEPVQIEESDHSDHQTESNHAVHHVHSNQTVQQTNTSEEAAHEEIQTSTQELTTVETTMTTEDVTTMTTEEEMTTTEMATSTTTTTARPTTTTTVPMRRSNNNNNNSSGRKHKRSVKRKRSCYPATCILKKLNLLDSMGQPSIKQIQKFAVNMTVDDSMNLEEKAVECVKEINEAMIDASADIGKKVGCVSLKVITCMNKGLTCPIMKVPQ